jgi:AraC-like DNA-binding protein
MNREMSITEIVYEVGYRLPNGAVVQKSVLPTEPLPFNEWAAQLGVSSSYIGKTPTNRAMEQIREWGLHK